MYFHEFFKRSKKASESLSTLHIYVKNKDYYGELLSKRDYAIKNAEKLNMYHSYNEVSLESVKSNPSTQVHELIALIRGFNNQKLNADSSTY